MSRPGRKFNAHFKNKWLSSIYVYICTHTCHAGLRRYTPKATVLQVSGRHPCAQEDPPIYTMESTVSYLAQRLHSINTSLLSSPPSQEGSYDEICLLGPNGESTDDLVTVCGDLEPGLRPNLASWFISPEQHVRESLLVIGMFGTLLVLAQSSLRNMASKSSNRIRHPFWMKPVAIFCYSMMIRRKLHEARLTCDPGAYFHDT